MNLEEFRNNYFGDSEEIAVNCVWLQNLLKKNELLEENLENESSHVRRLLRKVNKLEEENWKFHLNQPYIRRLHV